MTPLHLACKYGNLEGCHYDAEQNVALHWAAYSGSVDIVALLLEHGCQVNAANLHGDTPL